MVCGHGQEAMCVESPSLGDITPLLMNFQCLFYKAFSYLVLADLTNLTPVLSPFHLLASSSTGLCFCPSCMLGWFLLLLLFSRPEIIFYYLSTARSSPFSGSVSNDISSKRPALTAWFSPAIRLLAVTLLYFCTLCSYLNSFASVFAHCLSDPSWNASSTRAGTLPLYPLWYFQHLEQSLAYSRCLINTYLTT